LKQLNAGKIALNVLLWIFIASVVTGVVFLVMYWPVLILLGGVGSEGDLSYFPSFQALLNWFTIPLMVGIVVLVVGLAWSLIYRKR